MSRSLTLLLLLLGVGCSGTRAVSEKEVEDALTVQVSTSPPGVTLKVDGKQVPVVSPGVVRLPYRATEIKLVDYTWVILPFFSWDDPATTRVETRDRRPQEWQVSAGGRGTHGRDAYEFQERGQRITAKEVKEGKTLHLKLSGTLRRTYRVLPPESFLGVSLLTPGGDSEPLDIGSGSLTLTFLYKEGASGDRHRIKVTRDGFQPDFSEWIDAKRPADKPLPLPQPTVRWPE